MIRRFVRLATVILVVTFAFACSSASSPTAPTVGTTPTTQAGLAPPPAGVSVALWQSAFYPDGKLHRVKDGEVIHLDISALPPSAQAQLKAQAAVAQVTMKGKQLWDTTPVQGGVNYIVTITGAEINCGGVVVKNGACTTNSLDSATQDVTGGTMQFTSLNIIIQGTATTLHEIFRTTGLVRNAPAPSIMAVPAAVTPTDEDALMLVGRYSYPSGALFAEK